MFSSFFGHRSSSATTAAVVSKANRLKHATGPVIQTLESRTLMSAAPVVHVYTASYCDHGTWKTSVDVQGTVCDDCITETVTACKLGSASANHVVVMSGNCVVFDKTYCNLGKLTLNANCGNDAVWIDICASRCLDVSMTTGAGNDCLSVTSNVPGYFTLSDGNDVAKVWSKTQVGCHNCAMLSVNGGNGNDVITSYSGMTTLMGGAGCNVLTGACNGYNVFDSGPCGSVTTIYGGGGCAYNEVGDGQGETIFYGGGTNMNIFETSSGPQSGTDQFWGPVGSGSKNILIQVKLGDALPVLFGSVQFVPAA